MSSIICIGGPTGAGKDATLSFFLKKERNKDLYIRVPRSTTRQKRSGEVDGIHYDFVSDDEFSILQNTGLLIGVDIFCNFKYGINLRRIDTCLENNKNVIGIFGVCAYDLKKIYSNRVKLIYIRAPINILNNRLIDRGDEKQEIEERIKAAKLQLEDEPCNFDHIIENTNTIENTVLQLESIIKLRR